MVVGHQASRDYDRDSGKKSRNLDFSDSTSQKRIASLMRRVYRSDDPLLWAAILEKWNADACHACRKKMVILEGKGWHLKNTW